MKTQVSVGGGNCLYWSIINLIYIIAIFFRLKYFILNYQLVGDESNLVIPLMQHSYKTIFFAHDELGELAPPIFMFIIKIITNIFSYSEYTLRIIPLISSILSCFLFYYTSKCFLQKKYSICFALLLFAFCFPFIRMSGFFKPYTTEVLFSMLALYFLGIKYSFKNKSYKNNIILSLVCLFCYLSSFQSVFIIFSCFTTHLIYNIFFQKDLKTIKHILFTICLNLGIVFLYYKLFLHKIATDNYLYHLWDTDYNFLPNTYHSLGQLIDFFINASYWGIANKNTIFIVCGLFALGFIAFVINILKTKDEKEIYNLMLIIASISSFTIAALLKIYPFANRLVISLFPIFIIIISKSLDIKIKKLTIIYNIIFILIFSYFLKTTDLYVYNQDFYDTKISNIKDKERKNTYKKIKDMNINQNTLMYFDTDAFLTAFVYNRMYKFSNNILSFYHYPHLSKNASAEYIYKKLSKEKIFFAMLATDYKDEITREIGNLIRDNYNLEEYFFNPDGNMIFVKCTQK